MGTESGKIERSDLISDEALRAPLELAEGYESLLTSLDKIIVKAKEGEKSLNMADNISDIRDQTKTLAQTQADLARTQDRLIRQGEEHNVQLGVSAKRTKEETDATRSNTSAKKENADQGSKLNATLKQTGESLDKLAPGLTGSAKGFIEMTKAGVAFLMTPIGIAVAVLAGALYSLTAFLRDSEEGQNKLNTMMKVGHVIFERFSNVVEAIGGFLFDLATKTKVLTPIINAAFLPIKTIVEGFKFLFPEAAKAAGDFFQEIIDDATELSGLEADITKQERELVKLRSSTALQVAQLREAAVKTEGDAKKKFIDQAIALERALSNAEVKHAENKLALARANARISGEDIEALDAVAKAEAAVDDARTKAFDNTLKFQKQLESLRDEEIKKEKELLKIQQDRAAYEDARAKKNQEDLEKFIAGSIAKGEAQDKTNQAYVEGIKIEEDAKEITDAEFKSLQVLNAEREFGNLVIAQSTNLLGQFSTLFKEQTKAQQNLQVAATLISTWSAAQRAYESQFIPSDPSSLFRAIAAASFSVAQGLIRVGNIKGVKFAKGTRYSPEGPAIVGEEGMEMIINPRGGVSFTPPQASLTYLEKGSQVLTHAETMQALAMNSLKTGGGGFNGRIFQKLGAVETAVKKSAQEIVFAVLNSNGALLEHGSVLYKSQKTLDGNRRIIRLKSFSS